MSLGLEVISAIVSAIASVLATGMVGFGAWYFKKYVLTEVEKNSSMRRYVIGQEGYENDGEIHEIRERIEVSEEERKEEHREVRKKLEFVTEYVRRIAAAVNREMEEEVRNPETGEAEFTRGGSDD